MKYDFDSVIDRHGWDSVAVDGPGLMPGLIPDAPKEGFSRIPMWIADMNFATFPAVRQALEQRAAHPIYGYFLPTEDYYKGILYWQAARHGMNDLRPEYIGYENGVLGGMMSALRAVCAPGDTILVHSPCYSGFIANLENCGYHILFSPLVVDEAGVWRMDYEDMERKLSTLPLKMEAHPVQATILCSPHNPSGRVWERWELEKAMALFQKYDVYVISDEIWADLTLPGHTHVPTQSVSEDAKRRTVALYAAGKTFNLSGLVGAYHIVYDGWLRKRLEKTASLSAYNTPNVFAVRAQNAAYQPEGGVWVDELRQVLGENAASAYTFFRERVPEIGVQKPQGTYMLFLDCTAWCRSHGKTLEELLRAGWEVGVAWQDGRLFDGACHIRMNLALPPALLREALDRLAEHVFC